MRSKRGGWGVRIVRQQPQSAERLQLSQDLFRVLCGVLDLGEIAKALAQHGYDIRRLNLPDDGVRFVVFQRRSGAVFDHFDFFVDDEWSVSDGD